MKINLVFSDRNVAAAIGQFLENKLHPERIEYLFFNESNVLSAELLSADLWIIEAIHKYRRPDGFNLAMQLAGKSRALLIFSVYKPRKLPDEGDFWTVYHSLIPLNEKIRNVMHIPPPTDEDYKNLIKTWNTLGYKPSTHHHSATLLK